MKSHKNRIDFGQISHLAQSYFSSKSKIQIMSKAFVNHPSVLDNRTDSLMLSFDNNSIMMLWPESGMIKSIIYPPPTPTSISNVIYCMAVQRVFVLLASGSLCVYNTRNRDTATMDKLQHSKQLKDYEGKNLSQQITAMNIISVEPPCTDCEIFSDLHKYNPIKKDDISDSESKQADNSSDLNSETDDFASNTGIKNVN